MGVLKNVAYIVFALVIAYPVAIVAGFAASVFVGLAILAFPFAWIIDRILTFARWARQL